MGVRFLGRYVRFSRASAADSRRIKEGDIFWALPGPHYDGHDFVFDALQKGAAGAVVRETWWASRGCQRITDPDSQKRAPSDIVVVADTLKALGDLGIWWRRRHGVTVVGITGSSGKTTTKEMVAGICGLTQKTLKNEGNFNNLIGLPLTLLGLKETHDTAVLEMGMNRPGEIARLTEIAAPDVGVILNIGMAHLEGLGTLQGVAHAKCEMIERMPSNGLMVLNGDDGPLMKNAERYGVRKLTFGYGRENNVRATKIEPLDKRGFRFTLVYGNDAWPVRIHLPGRHNVSNALAAAAVSFGLGASSKMILKGLSAYRGMKGRFMMHSFPGGVTVVDDTYNANPSSLKAALASIKTLAGEEDRLIVCLAEMLELGEATVRSHWEAGKWVSESGADLFFAFGSHKTDMKAGAIAGGLPEERIRLVDDHNEMIKGICDSIGEGTLVFLKGSRKMALDRVVEGLAGALKHGRN
ncbi:MAG: UDP-N-acetylmuramoyl-tripeptide--D-alanyl-D-alanine ligase [Deltaproteobacteria bacterium]|nr:UDP-N-acetylmuramoyl-tripeptide--D-alanyl-D-alanine ligase [Deltaproteobacteria bacterium]